MPLDSLQQYIRFAISQLSSQNSQAEFEKICLYFSRQRIHGNILPATGPVQAGGDQGRDFETFHTYLSNSSIKNSSFVAEHSNKPVVFACSMEKDPTKKNGKINSDVRTITSKGVAVDRIYFFSGQDIPVAARHKSIADVKNEFRVDLEIIDANALAQHLSEPDLFWVATQFLKIPADYFPERKEEDWYTKLMKEYRTREKPITSYEEFEDVKSAIRNIYKDKALKSDLTFWFPKFDQLIADGAIEGLVRKAIYERFVTAFVGLDYVEGQEGNIERYFNNFESYLSNSELEDANHLLSFCQTAVARGRLKLKKDYLEDVSNRMDELITNVTENAVTPDNKCAILEIRASFNLNDRRGDRDFDRNFGRYVSGLEELVANLGDAHFFPFERLADRLNKNLTFSLKITNDVSPLEKSRKRSMMFLRKRVLRLLSEVNSGTGLSPF